MAGVGRDDRIDPNLRENYLKEEKRIESDQIRFERNIGADRLSKTYKLDNMPGYHTKPNRS